MAELDEYRYPRADEQKDPLVERLTENYPTERIETMDQEKYKEVARLQAQATRAASELLDPMWDDMLEEYERTVEGLCPECGGEPGDDGWCESCQREADHSPLMALDPLSIEDDGRIILGFGGPNIWIDAADNLCYAWWDSAVRAPSPSSRHDAMVETWREEILELA